MNLFLAPHVFAARVENVVILLDSKSDDYLLVEPEVAPCFLRLLSPEGYERKVVRSSDPILEELIQQLETRGSITADARNGKALELLRMTTGSLEVPGPRVDSIPWIGFGHVVAIVMAMIRTFYLLKIRNLHTAIGHVRGLRARARLARPAAGDASELVEIYHRLRPIFYSSKDRCLFNSLSLIVFLARYGICPSWWFGVRLNPFMAHCWVEDGQWLYNDQYMRTCRYTPIMRV